MTDVESGPESGALYARNPDIVLREEDEDGALLFNPDTNDVRILNTTGLFIWRAASGVTLDALVESVSGAFDDVPADRVRADVWSFMSGLLSDGFLGELDASGGGARA
ncbi:MAG TPA: PqqD family peptide modification chaperone [Candidatus Fermentibacter daniensis]|jgi:hypothetical protein|nr:MAG: hypothetical protein AO394_06900 [Candidatus Fermentibacter daniensis]MBP7719203.1 PqqD family peptide modification chaperone [Candidatus Fermentibacter sp.]KZD17477.1 MAG: hypothetical protein AO395_01875 [Candidatus Fermentibacter daniensis]KZD19544.1 MAG: hypothetical protein AO396_08910 [Candidatus Fermentibacter daniensis]MCC6871622.1 PqqD family peptide modification chaperone [Candidatus Fermentibacter sp.]